MAVGYPDIASDDVRYDNGFGFFFQRNWSPQLAMPVGGAARAIVECNGARRAPSFATNLSVRD